MALPRLPCYCCKLIRTVGTHGRLRERETPTVGEKGFRTFVLGKESVPGTRGTIRSKKLYENWVQGGYKRVT